MKQLKSELDWMVVLGIIISVKILTKWIRSLAYYSKENRNLCTCMDMKELNADIHQDHYQIPAVEQLKYEFTGFCYFTNVDSTDIYCVVSSTESPMLITSQSIWSISISMPVTWIGLQSECVLIWQGQILQHCEGAVGIADVTVYQHIKEGHDTSLCYMMKVTCKHCLVFKDMSAL